MKITVEKAGIEGRLDESIIINGRWQIYKDGCIYDIQSGKDIPQDIFILRDFFW